MTKGKLFFSLMLYFLAVFAEPCHPQECSRLIETGNSTSQSWTIHQNDTGLSWCIDVSPIKSERNVILLKLPPSVSVSVDGNTYESKDDSHRYCFLMTPYEKCSILRDDNDDDFADECPGGATAEPFFEPTRVTLKISSRDASNEVKIGYMLIYREYNKYWSNCTKLQPPTVAQTTTCITSGATTPVTSSVTTEQTQNEFTSTKETSAGITSMSIESSRTEITTGASSGAESADTRTILYIVIVFVIVIFCVAGYLVYRYRKKNAKTASYRKNNKKGTTQQDTTEMQEFIPK